MKTGRGWWALAGLGVLTLLGLYVGAYYALVAPGFGRVSGSIGMVPHYPIQIHDRAEPFFAPVHRIDRVLRPQTWKWPCASEAPAWPSAEVPP